MDNMKEFVLETLRRGSEVARGHFGRVRGTTKPNDRTQVVTQADLDIARLVAEALEDRFPDHNRIDEELGAVDRGSPYTWVIDPIDGTSNFAVGIPLYGVMIGLLHEDRPFASGIALPAFDAFYWAERGGGAWCGDRRLSIAECDLAASLVALGIDGHPEDPARTREECRVLAEVAIAVRNVRASNCVYDGVMLAEGRYGAWMVRTSRIWDNVAPQLLIEEAGGRFTRIDGGPVVYDRPSSRIGENYSMCAAAPGVHDQLQAILGHAEGRR